MRSNWFRSGLIFMMCVFFLISFRLGPKMKMEREFSPNAERTERDCAGPAHGNVGQWPWVAWPANLGIGHPSSPFVCLKVSKLVEPFLLFVFLLEDTRKRRQSRCYATVKRLFLYIIKMMIIFIAWPHRFVLFALAALRNRHASSSQIVPTSLWIFAFN